MADPGQAAFVHLSDGFGSVFAQWQSYWLDQVVAWDSRGWTYQQFDWAGITSGQAVGDQASLTLPATPSVIRLSEAARAGAWVAQLQVIQFDEAAAGSSPPAVYSLVASCVGQVVGLSGNLTQLTWKLGSALAPLGAQFPPTTAITTLIGVPCRL